MTFRLASAPITLVVLLTVPGILHAQAQAQAQAQEFPLTDAKGLIEKNVKAAAADFLGRKAVRLTKGEGAGGDGFALLPGVEFQDGTIEADLAVKITTPPGVRMPGFIGIAFRAKADASSFDMFYIRPGNASAEDQSMRNHAAQYVAAPGFGWYELRRAWPWVYESHADLTLDAWTHIKIEITGRTGRLYVNGSSKPTLIVDGLKGPNLRGAIGLMCFSGEEAYFSNVRITPAAPQPIANGSDAAGTWQVAFNTDVGQFKGTLTLQRTGETLTGTWSGALGENRPVAGTWREGYVELSFTGQWPKEMSMAPAAEVKTRLAGWIDGASAKGRMTIEARADGQWTATKAP